MISFLIITTVIASTTVVTAEHHHQSSSVKDESINIHIQNLAGINRSNQGNISFDLQIRSQGGTWQNDEITAYVDTILEFRINIVTTRGYPLTLSAAISLNSTDQGAIFDYIENSETSSKRTTYFVSTDQDVLFIWLPLFASTITCSFKARIQRTAENVNIKGAVIGVINADNADASTDNITLTAQPSPYPEIPEKPQGTISGYIHENHSYTAQTIDPYDRDLYYRFSWGDRTQSDWIGPVPSGQIVATTNSWDQSGTFFVRVKAKNTEDFESDWSDPLIVSMEDKIKITKPDRGIYLANAKLFSFPTLLIFGAIEIEIITPGIDEVSSVSFLIDSTLKQTIETEPYHWLWDEPYFGSFSLTIIVTNTEDEQEQVILSGYKIF